MLGLPTGDWSATPTETPSLAADWCEMGAVEHVFTHFSLTLEVRAAAVDGHDAYQWMEVDAARAALPTVFAKALDCAAA